MPMFAKLKFALSDSAREVSRLNDNINVSTASNPVHLDSMGGNVFKKLNQEIKKWKRLQTRPQKFGFINEDMITKRLLRSPVIGAVIDAS